MKKENETLSEKKVNVMDIDAKLWTEPYGSEKMLEENPFSKEDFINEKDVKEFIKRIEKKSFVITDEKPSYLRGRRVVELAEIDKLAGPTLAGKSEEKN